MAGTPKPERLRPGGVVWGGSPAPWRLAGAGAGGLGTRGDPAQSTHLPLASGCRCYPSSSPSHILPLGWVTLRVCSLDGGPSCCRATPRPTHLAAGTTAEPAGQPPVPSSYGAATSAASAHQGLTGALNLWEVEQRALPGASQGPGPPSSSLKQWASRWPPGQAPGQGPSFPSLAPVAGEGKSLWRPVGRPVHLSGSALALQPQPCSAGWPAPTPCLDPETRSGLQPWEPGLVYPPAADR